MIVPLTSGGLSDRSPVTASERIGRACLSFAREQHILYIFRTIVKHIREHTILYHVL